MRRLLAVWYGLSLTGVTASGCSSGRVAESPPVSTAVPCPALGIEGPQLVFPIPGATGIPVTAGSLVVSGGLPATAIVELAPQTGTILDLGDLAPVPSPLPEPEATPERPGSPLAGVPYPPLAPNTLYAVTYKDTASPCPLQIGSDGQSFVTR